MNEVQRLFQPKPQVATAPSDFRFPAAAASSSAGLNLRRPRFVEKAVAAADFLLIVLTSLASAFCYHWFTGGSVHVAGFIGFGFIFATNFTAITAARRNYRLKNLMLVTKQIRETIGVWSIVYGLLAVVGFAIKISSDFSRVATILFFVLGLFSLLVLRFVVARFISQSLANNSFAEKRIIVIAQQSLAVSSRPLLELKRHGYLPIKICQLSDQEIASGGASLLRAKLTELIEFARNEQIDEIYLLLAWNHHRAIDGILDALTVLPISVHLIPDENAARFLSYPTVDIGGTWTSELRRAPLTRGELAAKRCFDVSLALSALVVLAPLMLLTASLIKLDLRGPILFRQKRNGFNGHTFNIFKFRTMHVLEDGPDIRQTTRNDPRVTQLGRWLRRSSIDELPQLFNVIRGEMSLVGPRPHATSHNSEYAKTIANYSFRHHVKPGLTGWAQVNGLRGETQRLELMEQRVEHDLWYINNWTPLLDLKIILQTVVVAARQTTAY